MRTGQPPHALRRLPGVKTLARTVLLLASALALTTALAPATTASPSPDASGRRAPRSRTSTTPTVSTAMGPATRALVCAAIWVRPKNNPIQNALIHE